MKESLLMPDETKKKWLIQLSIGTLIPAVIGLILMLTGKFEMPAESWEFIATVFTFILFWRYHYKENVLHSSDKSKEKNLDRNMTALILLPAFIWAILTFPWFIPHIPPTLRLVLRSVCGILMFAVILRMNWRLWKYWRDPKWQSPPFFNENRPADDPHDHYVRSELLLCMVDLPIAISLFTVILGCLIIVNWLPDETIVHIFKQANASWDAPAIHHARISITSAFYGGAAAFHMMLGNAVFSFIQSGRLHSVIAAHSKFRPKGNPA